MLITALLMIQLSVGDLSVPAGYTRIAQPGNSFGTWLRQLKIRTDKTVYLYNRALKRNQSAQYAVLDISVGNKDLQQCADAVMRLYAEYQFSRQQYNKIVFKATDGTVMDFTGWMQGDRYRLSGSRLKKERTGVQCSGAGCLAAYLEKVFTYAGTLSLSKELVPVNRAVLPGDVLITGGSPGHAVIVMDVAENNKGERIYMLAQSYMPAQDIHILRNRAGSGAWYTGDPRKAVDTPEWSFPAGSLKCFR